ncbi:MAG: serine hydrolase domain-containing protein [Methylocystis sp.]
MTTAAETLALPERVLEAARARVASGYHYSLVFGVVDGDRAGIATLGALPDGLAPDGDTLYEIGSITKTFTGLLLAQAVLAGRLSLDTPVEELLPDFKLPTRGGRKITLGVLADHTSGLPRVPPDQWPKDVENPYADYDAAKLKAFLAGYDLPRDPGAREGYSNLGFGLLGYVLARAANRPYPELVEQEIFRPLGMTMSVAAFARVGGRRLASGHDISGKIAQNWDMDALAGAGAILSCANDMLRYLMTNMGATATPLLEAMKLAQAPKVVASGADQKMRVGLAWITTDKNIVWHNGGTGGYRSFLGFTADGRRGVIILSDSDCSVDDLGFATLDPDAPLAPSFTRIALPDAELDDYVGAYSLGEWRLLRIERGNGALRARYPGGFAIPIFPCASNAFFARELGFSMRFKRDEKKDVIGLVMGGADEKDGRLSSKLGAEKFPPSPVETQLDAATLADYVGVYALDSETWTKISLEHDHLVEQTTAERPRKLSARAKDAFFLKDHDIRLDFERDASGKFVAMTRRGAGPDMRALRRPA